MRQHPAFCYYPTLAPDRWSVMFPPTRWEGNAATALMSHYMIAEYSLLTRLMRDTTLNRRALASAISTTNTTSPPPLARPEPEQ